MNTFHTRLHDLRRALRVRLAGLVAAAALTGFAFALFVLEGYNRAASLREGPALLLTAAALAAAAGGLVWGALRVWRRHRALRGIADKVEARHPELMDALHCAVELSERQGSGPNPVEAALLGQVEAYSRRIDFRAAVLPGWLRAKPLAALLTLGILLAAAASQLPVVEKAAHHLNDLRRGTFTALAVEPGHAEVGRGRDLTVAAEVLRGEPALHIEYDDADGQRRRHPVFEGETGRPELTFYDVRGEFRYRLLTPSVVSPWYGVEVYDPPELLDFALTTAPPAYTGLEPAEHREPADIEIIEGTVLHFMAETLPGHRAALLLDDREVAFAETDDGRHRLEHRPGQPGRYAIVVRDEHERETRTGRREIDIRRDEPPHVEIAAPGQDLVLEPGERVGIQVFAGDDFGVARVELSVTVAGGDPRRAVLHDAPDRRTPDVEAFHALDLADLGAEDGDVVIYFAEATDNRRPEGQRARSEVYFIEVREDVEPEEMDGMDGDTEELDVRALIVEVKRIIRETYRSLALEGRDQVRASQDLSVALSRVRAGLTELRTQVRELVGPDNELMDLLEAANEELETAESLLSRNRGEPAIPPEIAGLRNLVAFENAVRREMQAREGEGEGEGTGEAEEPGEPGEGEGDAPSGEDLPSFADLPPLLEDLNALIDSQSGLNRAMGRSERTGAPEDENRALAGDQRGLSTENRDIAQRLSQLPAAAPLTQLLEQADRSMDRAAEALDGHQPGRGERHGVRAGESLVNAAALLEGLINEMAGAMMLGLAERAGDLAGQQSGGAQASREAAAGERPPDGLEEAQTGLNTDFERLREDLDSAAAELRGQFPEAARNLEQVGRDLDQNRTGGTMTRAANALLYERFDRAEDFQEQAAADLDAAAGGLREAGADVPALSDAAVRRALAELDRARRELGQLAEDGGEGEAPAPGDNGEGDAMAAAENGEGEGPADEGENGAQRLADLRNRLSGLLGEAGDRLDDSQLRELSARLGEESGARTWDGKLRDTDAAVGTASRALLRHLRQSLDERATRRLSGDAPSRYQRQVEEYFRRLSEEDR
ncbi:MAG: hypothetical protein JJU00_11350 [Opitutales bacterium]|nr:hypothetical protein [Opitutales bacterium]